MPATCRSARPSGCAATSGQPGSVTPLALLNDVAGEVTVVLDARLAAADAVWVHPLTNDRTTRIAGAELVHFLEATGHVPVLFDA